MVSVCLSPLFPTTVLLGHLLLWSLSLPASRGALRGFLSTPYSASLSLTIYSDIPDTGKLLEYERGMLIRESQQLIWSPWVRQVWSGLGKLVELTPLQELDMEDSH